MPLRPGSAVGVNIVSGDFNMGATGTVTEVIGNKVYAFGHPFFNLGPIAFPMTKAYIHTLLPSMTSSMKISTLGDVIGTVQQDRATTIAGLTGAAPATIPVKISLESERGFKKQFEFRVVSDQLFTPLFTYASILSTLTSYERETGAATFNIKGTMNVKSHGEIKIEDLFSGNSASMSTAGSVMAPLTFLLDNDFEPIQIEAVDLTIQSTEQPRTATIERVWLDGVRARAGRTVPLKVLMRTYRGEEVVHTVPLEIPANATGSLSVMVSDGARLAQWERREVRQPTEPRSVPQLMRALNTVRKNNRLYVRLLASDAGAVVRGEPLSSLPPSVLGVLEADRSTGDFIPLRNATLGEWNLPTEHAVVGSRMLTITHRVSIRMRSSLRNFFVFALVAAAVTSLSASKPVFWQTATLNDFLRGEVENLSVDGHGRLVLGPATELVAETTSPFLWAMAVAPDGSIYVGSGNEGKVFKIDAAGKAQRSSIPPSSRCMRWCWHPTARCTRPPRPKGASTRSIAPARACRFSIRKTSTSGAWRSTRKGTSTRAPARRG